MSFLLKKSDQNRHATDFLIDKMLYAPAIHCGYYSCFQKIVYILIDYYPDDYDFIQQQIKERRKGSLHGSCIKAFIGRFRPFDRRDALDLDTMLNDLKGFRINSDYNDDEVKPADANKVKEIVDKTHFLIKRHMKV